ncbi:MAG: ADP-ribosylglycohydrolase family protein [Oligoflexales bacterium]
MKIDKSIQSERVKKLQGVLLGTAVGDALGLPFENLPSHKIIKTKQLKDRFYFYGNNGVVSDDTELSALLAESLILFSNDRKMTVKSFKIALLSWFLRLPWGIGFGTLKSCLKILIGFKTTGAGIGSAGNGVAMRSSIIGVYYHDCYEDRIAIGKALAQVTHQDERAIEGGLFTAEVAAILSRDDGIEDIASAIETAKKVINNEELLLAIENAQQLYQTQTPRELAATELGTSGYVISTVSFAVYCFLKYGKNPLNAIHNAIISGGDTDTIAAIVGAWSGAYYGLDWIPENLLNNFLKGPFGVNHLKKLGMELSKKQEYRKVPKFSGALALARNILLLPLVLFAFIKNLLPFN